MSRTCNILGYMFIYNGDYSGAIKILPPAATEPAIEIPYSVLESFVLGKMKTDEISRIEQESDLALKFRWGLISWETYLQEMTKREKKEREG